jgi:hypothetical protein
MAISFWSAEHGGGLFTISFMSVASLVPPPAGKSQELRVSSVPFCTCSSIRLAFRNGDGRIQVQERQGGVPRNAHEEVV